MIKIPISIGEDDYLLWVETRTETTEAEAGDYDTPGVPAETRLVSCEIDTIKKWIDGAWIDVSLITLPTQAAQE